ncbi:MAG: hypothetical protein O3C63_05070 [Cyanobacteria bacterium]|nr:hypothetical protein [Cyanobacteriota bacterium]MDA1020469.1 hypothetical protein [Cyanobacteriota bacterium]
MQINAEANAVKPEGPVKSPELASDVDITKVGTVQSTSSVSKEQGDFGSKSNRDLAESLIKQINKSREDFTENVAAKFSVAEVVMGIVLTATRRRLDDFAYLVTSLLEYAENAFNLDSQVNKLPKPIKDAFSFVLNLVGRKTPDGQKISAEKLILHKEAMIGTMNFFTNIPVLFASVFRGLRALSQFKEVERYEPNNFMAKLFLYGAPLLNAATMSVSAAGKISPAQAMKAILNRYNVDDKLKEKTLDDANAGLNSAVEDKYCGLMSAGLTFTPIIGKLIPRIDSFVENVYAAFISGLSVVNGYKGMINGFHEESYTPSAFETRMVKLFEPAKQMISSLLGTKIPSLKQFNDLIKEPSMANMKQLAGALDTVVV